MEFVGYYRVSTRRQGESGLGLESQKNVVFNYVTSQPKGALKHEFTEIESGKCDNRMQLQAALHYCQMTGATLVVSKLDRLSRDLAFIASLMKSKNVNFVVADNPHANSLTIGIMGGSSRA